MRIATVQRADHRPDQGSLRSDPQSRQRQHRTASASLPRSVLASGPRSPPVGAMYRTKTAGTAQGACAGIGIPIRILRSKTGFQEVLLRATHGRSSRASLGRDADPLTLRQAFWRIGDKPLKHPALASSTVLVDEGQPVLHPGEGEPSLHGEMIASLHSEAIWILGASLGGVNQSRHAR
jgi:hypothetical protein